ncbi:MAG TPA: hypothetical protein VGH19_12845 [Verrucomicrobiae bacterium]
MKRLPFMISVLLATMAAASLVPLIGHGKISSGEPMALTVTIIAAISLITGLVLAWRYSRQPSIPLPAPVRMVITSCILFLAFCALEFSDGLVNHGGRVLYWTSVLFLPALALFFGLVLAQRWAWWLARIASAILTLWFIIFICFVPFTQLKSNGVPIPDIARLYVFTVTLIFALTTAYAFHSLSRTETKAYFSRSHS